MYALLVHLPFRWLTLPKFHGDDGLLSTWLIKSCNLSQTQLWIGGMLLSVVIAIQCNYMFTTFRFRQSNWHIASPFVIMFSAIHPATAGLSAPLIAMVFISAAVISLVNTYTSKHEGILIFNAGFFCAWAALWYTASFWFLLLFILGLNTFRGFRFKEYLILLIGFLVPFIWVFTWCFWKGSLSHCKLPGMQWIGTIPYLDFDLDNLIPLGIAILGGIFSIVHFAKFRARETLRNQKCIDLIYLVLFMVAASALLFHQVHLDHLALISMPIGFFAALYVLDLKPRQAELVHFVLLLLVISIHIYRFF